MPVALRGSAFGYSDAYAATGGTVASGAFTAQPQTDDVISVLVIAQYTTSAPTITDNAGNTYTQTGSVVGDSGIAAWRFRCPVTATNADLRVTATWGSVETYQRSISCAAISGADTASPIGVSGGAKQAPGITTTDGTTTGALGAPAEDGHFFHGLAASAAVPSSFAVGTGFTSIGVQGTSVRAEYLIQATAASIAATWTQDDTGTTMTVAQSIKPASGGGGGGAVAKVTQNLTNTKETDMRVIPSNTATAALRRIPFTLVDATDGFTPEDISVTSVKVALSIDGGTSANSTNDIVKVDGATGRYYLELTQTEANQTAGAVVFGRLAPSGCWPREIAAQIGPSGVFASTVDANVTQFGGVAGTFASGRPEVNLTHIAGAAVSTSTAQLGVNVVNFGGAAGTFASGRPEVNTARLAGQTVTASGGVTFPAATLASTTNITAASGVTVSAIGTGVITAASIAADAIGASELAADAATEIANAVLTAAASAPIAANMTQISGDAAAADALESYTDGTDRMPVDVKEINSVVVQGAGTSGNLWRA